MKEILERLQETRQIELAKSILESNGYNVNKKMNEVRSPEIEKMMDFIDDAGEKYYRDGKGSEYEDILMRYNASEDDSGEEGYFATMSDEDIQGAYNELKNGVPGALEKKEFDSIVSSILSLGFTEQTIETSEGSVSYYTKGSVGILISEVGDIKSAAKYIL